MTHILTFHNDLYVSHMMNDYMVDHMVHRITTSRTDTAPARLTSSSSSARRPASRRRRQHTGLRADTYIYVICIHMHVYIRCGAPPPSFTHVYKHIYGRVEHRHSRHTALSRGLVDQHSYYVSA